MIDKCSLSASVAIKFIGVAACMLILLSTICCKQDNIESPSEEYNQEGVLIAKQAQWKVDVTGMGSIASAVSPAIYDGMVVVSGTDDQEQDILLALDLESGQERWRWAEFNLPNQRIYSINGGEYGINQKDHLWILQYDESFYCIDLETGTTVWSQQRAGFSGVLGVQILRDTYYTSFDLYQGDLNVPTLFAGDVLSTSFDSVYSPSFRKIYNHNGSYGTMNEPLIYELDGEIHAFLTLVEFIDLQDYKQINYMSSLNLTTGKMDFNMVQLGDTSAVLFSQRPVLVDDVIVVNANGKMHGIDRDNGEVIWTYSPFDNPFDGFMAYAEYKGTIYGVNDSGESLVVSINAATGEVNWEDRTVGSTDQVYFLNDVMYFSTGHLYAFDTRTGEMLWDILPEGVEIFQRFGGVRVIASEDESKKGKVIACTFSNCFCFEAER